MGSYTIAIEACAYEGEWERALVLLDDIKVFVVLVVSSGSTSRSTSTGTNTTVGGC